MGQGDGQVDTLEFAKFSEESHLIAKMVYEGVQPGIDQLVP